MTPTKVREIRKASGYSQAELAQLSGIPQTTLSGWEIGLPRDHAITRALILARILRSTVEDLFGCEDPRQLFAVVDETEPPKLSPPK
ncbi:MAG: helix-turn-helix transcriptional regulator [Candidatus Gastranaerophilaceae bacterium]